MNRMERKTKKVKKEGDTCRDCWTKRFRETLMAQFGTEKLETRDLTLPSFFNRELQAREDTAKAMREEFQDIYDEISAIEHLAGDVYMGRFDKDKKD